MRPLFHPSIDDLTVEGILHALSAPLRAHIFAGPVGAGVRDRREARRPTCAENAQGAGRVSVQVRSVGTSNRGVDGRASYRTLGWSHPVLTTHLTLRQYGLAAPDIRDFPPFRPS